MVEYFFQLFLEKSSGYYALTVMLLCRFCFQDYVTPFRILLLLLNEAKPSYQVQAKN